AAAEFSTMQTNRIRKLTEQGIYAKEQLDQAEADTKSKNSMLRSDRASIESARAAVKADDATVSNAKLNLSYCHIVSPVTGRTGNLLLKRGNLIKATDIDLISIHQIHPIYVTFGVVESALPAIRRQMKTQKLLLTADLRTQPPDSDTGYVTFLDNAV